jgi:hypothetical protein
LRATVSAKVRQMLGTVGRIAAASSRQDLFQLQFSLGLKASNTVKPAEGFAPSFFEKADFSISL